MKKVLSLDIKFSLTQILYFGAFCALMGYASVYLLDKGFTNSIIGIALALVSAIAVFAQPALAAFADKNKHIELRRIIEIIMVIIVALSLLIYFLKGASLFLLCIFVAIATFLNCVNFTKFGIHLLLSN